MNTKELIIYIAQGLVDNHQAVSVTEVKGAQTTVYELKAAKRDLGKIIGRQGRIVDALRTILHSIAAKTKRRISLEIIE